MGDATSTTKTPGLNPGVCEWDDGLSSPIYRSGGLACPYLPCWIGTAGKPLRSRAILTAFPVGTASASPTPHPNALAVSFSGSAS
jgi:hypothetical protein